MAYTNYSIVTSCRACSIRSFAVSVWALFGFISLRTFLISAYPAAFRRFRRKLCPLTRWLATKRVVMFQRFNFLIYQEPSPIPHPTPHTPHHTPMQPHAVVPLFFSLSFRFAADCCTEWKQIVSNKSESRIKWGTQVEEEELPKKASSVYCQRRIPCKREG